MTFNNLKQLFNNIADAHYQIKDFGFGDLWEIEGTNSNLYPRLWVVPQDSNILGNVVQRSFKFIVMDLVDKGEEIENEVLSDTEQILVDIIKILKNESFKYNVINDPQLVPFTEQHGDDVSGWAADIIIETDYNNAYCDVPAFPFTSPFTPDCTDCSGSSDGGLNCSDLPLCPTIITIENTLVDLQDQIDNLPPSNNNLDTTLGYGNNTGSHDIIFDLNTIDTLAYFDSNKALKSVSLSSDFSLIAGTLSLTFTPSVPTLTEVLAAGNTTGQLHITSDDLGSELDVHNGIMIGRVTLGSDQGYFIVDPTSAGLGTTGASINALTTENQMTHAIVNNITAPDNNINGNLTVTAPNSFFTFITDNNQSSTYYFNGSNDNGAGVSSTEAYIYASDGITTGEIKARANQNTIYHDTLTLIDSPLTKFTGLIEMIGDVYIFNNTFNTGFEERIVIGDGLSFKSTDGSFNYFLNINSASSEKVLISSDDSSFVGALYNIDYSSNFIDESLITKRYVVNSIASATASINLQTVTDNGNTTTNTIILTRPTDDDGYILKGDVDGFYKFAAFINSGNGGAIGLYNGTDGAISILLNGDTSTISTHNADDTTAFEVIGTDTFSKIKMYNTSDFAGLITVYDASNNVTIILDGLSGTIQANRLFQVGGSSAAYVDVTSGTDAYLIVDNGVNKVVQFYAYEDEAQVLQTASGVTNGISVSNSQTQIYRNDSNGINLTTQNGGQLDLAGGLFNLTTDQGGFGQSYIDATSTYMDIYGGGSDYFAQAGDLNISATSSMTFVTSGLATPITGTIQFQSGTFSTIFNSKVNLLSVATDNTSTNILLKDGSNTVVTRTIDSVVGIETEEYFDAQTGTTVSLAHTPKTGKVVKVFKNGLSQYLGAGRDYTISGTTITFTSALVVDDIQVIYTY